MKTNVFVSGIAVAIAVAALAGCKKEEPATTQQQQPPQATEGIASEAKKAVDTATTAAKQAAEQVAAQATAAQQQAQQQAQGIIDKAKSLVADKKYQDALTSLNQLTNLKLTPEQQKLVDDLKAQIQAALSKAAASDATSAVGGILGGKK